MNKNGRRRKRQKVIEGILHNTSEKLKHLEKRNPLKFKLNEKKNVKKMIKNKEKKIMLIIILAISL